MNSQSIAHAWIQNCDVLTFCDERGNAKNRDVKVTQDFELGTTTVTFKDNSALIFEGDSVQVAL